MTEDASTPGPVGSPVDRGVGRLSPLNLTALLRREVFDYEASPEEAKMAERKIPRCVLAYECPECEALYRWEDVAEECCQAAKEKAPDPHSYAQQCPVCGSDKETAEEASDCCLWKDLDIQTRHALARKVEAGSTWARELGVWPPNV